MLFLVDEMYRNVDKDFTVKIGKPIPFRDLRPVAIGQGLGPVGGGPRSMRSKEAEEETEEGSEEESEQENPPVLHQTLEKWKKRLSNPSAKRCCAASLLLRSCSARPTKSHNDIYVVTAHNAPNVMREIGRLREIAFRAAGGGTGKAVDIDEFDTSDNCYKQLIV